MVFWGGVVVRVIFCYGITGGVFAFFLWFYWEDWVGLLLQGGSVWEGIGWLPLTTGSPYIGFGGGALLFFFFSYAVFIVSSCFVLLGGRLLWLLVLIRQRASSFSSCSYEVPVWFGLLVLFLLLSLSIGGVLIGGVNFDEFFAVSSVVGDRGVYVIVDSQRFFYLVRDVLISCYVLGGCILGSSFFFRGSHESAVPYCFFWCVRVAFAGFSLFLWFWSGWFGSMAFYIVAEGLFWLVFLYLL